MRYQPFGGATAATGATPYYQAPSAYTYAAMHTDPSGYYASFGMPTQGYDPTASGMYYFLTLYQSLMFYVCD